VLCEDSRKTFKHWPLTLKMLPSSSWMVIAPCGEVLMMVYGACHLLLSFPYLPPWIVCIGLGDRAISLFFLCRAWHCGTPSLTTLLVRQFLFSDFFRLASHPCSSFLWPSELSVQAPLVNGSSFNRLAGTATCQWETCKLSCMPRVHQVAYLSIPFPLHWPFFCRIFLICLFEVSTYPLV
jgi:hypothetical protein